MSTSVEEPSTVTLSLFYEAERAYLASGDGDFSGIAATLDPGSASSTNQFRFPMVGNGEDTAALKHGCRRFRRYGLRWKSKIRSSTRKAMSS